MNDSGEPRPQPEQKKNDDNLEQKDNTKEKHHAEAPLPFAKSKVFVAVHTGAGMYSASNQAHSKDLCKKACRQAIDLLKANNSAVDAVTAAVVLLEEDESTNAGYGSNLTLQGNVECEACVMDGKSRYFGAVGAMTGVRNPIKVARLLVKEQEGPPLSWGRIKPSVLVGKGTRSFCEEHGIDTNYNMISKPSFKTYNRYKRKCGLMERSLLTGKERKIPKLMPKSDIPKSLTAVAEPAQDTVGAICVDRNGNIAVGSSSGGIWLKHSGRLGPVAMYGAGSWVQNPQPAGKDGVGIVASGCGEHLMQTIFAKTIADRIRESDCLSECLPKVFTSDFMESENLSQQNERYAGALILKLRDSVINRREGELGWIHSTDSFCFAFMEESQNAPKAILSHLSDESLSGKSFAMGGHVFTL